MLYRTLPICCLVIGAAFCSPERVQDDQGDYEGPDQESEEQETHDLQDHTARMDKRSPHYDFGLGKRAYTYVSEYKRLPVYNFGLGKRFRPVSFGLSKRSADWSDSASDESDVNSNANAAALLDLLTQQYDDTGLAKRARPYSFGLGKRSDLGSDVDDLSRDVNDLTEQKRAKSYNFGLGKRTQLLNNHVLDKRARAYSFGLGKRFSKFNFGLGKRISKFNFGLGKRQRDMHRFSFGLGKRSSNDFSYDTDNHYGTGILDY